MEFEVDTRNELSDAERKQIIESELAAAPDWVSEGTDRDVLRANVEAWLEETLKPLQDDDFAIEFAENCPHDDASVPDYDYKVVRMDDGETAVFSLRFEGLDPSRPFVEAVVCTAGPVLNPRQLNSVWNAVESLYGHIGIQRLRAFEPDVERKDSGAPRNTYDRLMLAGHVQDVASKTAELSEKGASVEFIEDPDSAFRTYVSEYEKMAESSPIHHRGSTWHRTEERFHKAVDEDLAFAVRNEGELAGIVLLGRGIERWLRGYYFSEMFLFAHARHRGLATPVQRAVANTVESDHDTHLYGTIDPRNEPAIHAARGAGRQLAGGYRFLRR